MIPLATTTVTVEQPAERADEMDGPSYETATGPHDAHVSAPSGSERVGGEGVERIDAVLFVAADVDISQGARVVDVGTSTTYRCSFATHRQGLGLDHKRCGLVAVEGRGTA